jgi:hypothetical protein
MKGIARYVTGSIVLALAGTVYLAAGLLDRRLADAGRQFAAQRYDLADATLEKAEHDLAYSRWIPWVNAALSDVHMRRTAAQYWSRQYDRILSDRSELPAVGSTNIDLQLIAANAVYRRGQPKATDRQSSIEALQAAANAYLAVLKNSRRNEVAAYNYEFVVRTREDIEKGRHVPELTDKADDGPAGRRGSPPPPQDPKRDLKLLVPLEPGEIDKGLEPGKGGAIDRKG